MTGQTMSAEQMPSKGKLTGWHVLVIMLGFFGVMFAVNGVFLYHAITSFPGEDVKKSYLQGLDYNQTLDAKAAQDQLGWSAAAGVVGPDLVFDLTDAKGNPLSGYQVMSELRRAASTAHDQTLPMQPLEAGSYAVNVSDLPAGRWDVQFQVMEPAAGDIIFRADKRVVITP